MYKYLAIFKLYYSSAIFKRADLIGNLITISIQVGAICFLWFSIYQNQTLVNGYTLKDTILYYSLIVVIAFITSTTVVDVVSFNIKNGLISQTLLRPLSLLPAEISRAFGEQTYRFSILLPVLLVFMFLSRIIHLYYFSYVNLVLGIIFLYIGFFINALIEYLLAMLSFWLDEVWSLKHFKEIITDLLGGKRLPLAFFPIWLQKLNAALPFQFIYFIPLEYLLGKRDVNEVISDLSLAFICITGLLIGSYILYSLGIRRYEAFGQ